MRTGNNQLEFYKPSNTYLITQYLKISHGPRNKVETLIRYYTLFKIQDTHCKDKINIYISSLHSTSQERCSYHI